MDLNFSIGGWADVVVNYILDHFTPALDMIAATIGFVTDGIQNALLSIPPVAGIGILTLLALWRVSWKFAIFTALALALIIHMGLWSGTMESLSLVLASTIIAVVIGIPLGIAMARSDAVASIVRPVLDLMQTMPAFVYLIPAAMFSVSVLYQVRLRPSSLRCHLSCVSPILAFVRFMPSSLKQGWHLAAPRGSCCSRFSFPMPCHPSWQA